MKFENQYIVQAVSAAANNLRLSSEKIEVVSLLRKHLSDCEDISLEIQEMKKITELSKLGIKLGQMHQFITSNQIDFLDVTNKFKEHSHNLVIELSHMLDKVAPITFREILASKDKEEINVELKTKPDSSDLFDGIELPIENKVKAVVVSEKKTFADEINSSNSIEEKIIENNEKKEEFILDELKDSDDAEFDFEDYESKILEPIKNLEQTLKQMVDSEFDIENLNYYIDLMLENAKHSSNIGFDIIANMHKVVAFTFKRIISKKIKINSDVIEGIRACLIVIVAVVRGKEVDITSYLKKAEEFGKYIVSIK